MNVKRAFGIILFVLIILLIVFAVPKQLERLIVSRLPAEQDTIVLDPGHGGIDGGAEGASGTCEKHINLAIAFEIKKLAEADGFCVVMTRDKDESLYTEKRQSIRSLKTEDLKARKKMVEEIKPLLFVSIHLNNFKQDRSVRGAQTFYPTGSGDQDVLCESKRLALAIQASLVQGLSDGTDRVALGKNDAYILKNPTVPMVIVECGFLSNREEEALLAGEDYQKKLALYIYKGILEYTGRRSLPQIEIIDTRGQVLNKTFAACG